MRKIHLLIIISLFLVSCKPKHPAICFETHFHDFGTIPFDTIATCTFTFANCGSAPLKIDHVSATCGCTEIRHTDRPISPNDTGSIRIRYYPDATGEFRKIAVVHSNATDSQKVALRMKGFVINDTL